MDDIPYGPCVCGSGMDSEISRLRAALEMIARYPYPAVNGSFSQQEIARAALAGGKDPETTTRLLLEGK